jgi:hypothetical protein
MENNPEVPDLKTISGPSGDHVSPGQQSGQPTSYEACQAGYTAPYFVVSQTVKEVYEKLLDGMEKYQATPSPSPEPPPSVGRQRISRPLDLRKGGEIHLTEEEVQLARSPVPVVGPSSFYHAKPLGLSPDAIQAMKKALASLYEDNLFDQESPLLKVLDKK